jgi:Tol biopolymer transport system component/predicted Ser/Thr protein kinase
MPIAAGTRLGSYEIISAVGSGGMGVVYRAHDSKLQRTVAIKVLGDGGEVADEASRQRLLHEARAASALNHPNVCVIYEVDESAGPAFIVMEYVDGKPLSELIPTNGMPREALLRYGMQIADALAHAHDRGIIHRDLKSSNVIVSKDGRAKVVDFGLARRVARPAVDVSTSSNILTVDAKLAGTLSHMAPEVLQGDSPTVASDIWALGVLLYELSSGHLPFSGRTPFDLSAAILRGVPPPLPAHVQPSVRMIVARCLAREPGERYGAAGEVRAALQAVESDSAMAIPASIVPRRRLVSVAGWGLGAILALAGATGAWLNIRSREEAARQTSPAPGRLALLVASDRRAFDPSLSPDGKMIGYVAQDENGRLDLFVSRVAGGGRVKLTNDEASEAHPRFSPDGERIMFARRSLDSGNMEICVVPTLGGEVSVVLRDAAYPVWSPTGNRIAFIQVVGPGTTIALATARTDGSDLRQLLMADAAYPFLRYPAWSPDGATVAVIRGTGGVAGEIWLLSADREQLRRLSNDRAAVFSDQPVFTSDGRSVVHSSNRGGATNIWSVPLDGGSPVRLTTGPGPDESPTVAKGGEIAFVNSRWRNGLITHDLASGKSRLLLTHSPFLWGPAFSPDGRELAFSRGEIDGQWHVWVMPAVGGPARQLTSGTLGELYPIYTPDGQSVVYHTWGAPRRIWRIPRAGGPPIPLTPADLDATFADISPDGTTLVFVVTEQKARERVYTLRLAEGRPRLLTASPASVPRWSPDGKWIAFAADRGYGGGIFVVRPDGTDERRLTQTGGWPVWRPDSRHIGYATIAPDGRQQIETIALDGPASAGPVHFRFEGANFPFGFSPDGRTMATSNAVHVSDEIWLLEPAG